MLAITSSRRKQPLSLRSSVRNAMPASIAVPGFLIAISLPSIAIVPEVAGVTPNRVSATLLRPEPTRPAKPRISPLRRSKEMSRKRPSRERLRTESATSPIGTVCFGNIWVISRPTIMLDDVVAGDVGGGVLADEVAVAKHRHLVGDLEQLVHLVGDVDDALALRLQRTDDLEEMLDLALGQRRRRLVHDENVGIVGDRLGDLDHLPVGDREVAHLRFRIDRDVEPLEQRLGPPAHLVVTHEAEAR